MGPDDVYRSYYGDRSLAADCASAGNDDDDADRIFSGRLVASAFNGFIRIGQARSHGAWGSCPQMCTPII